MQRLGSPGGGAIRNRRERPLKLVTLEDRVVFSASPLAALPVEPGTEPADGQSADSVPAREDGSGEQLDQSASSDQQAATDDGPQSESTAGTTPPSSATPTSPPDEDQTASDALTVSRNELVIIDAAVGDYQQFIDDLLSGDTTGRNFEFVVLDDERDGIEQISQLLGQYDDIDALHIVSHGKEGAVKLGSAWLSMDNVGSYAGQLTGWGDALAADADMLFYGCDLASNDEGKLLVESLGAICDCDVAASVDDTGQAALGGDWNLEYHAGVIETEVAFSTQFQEDWNRVLALLTFQEGVSGYTGAQDTYLNQDAADTSHGSDTFINVDLDVNGGTAGNQEAQGLIRFDNLFGNGPGQIPYGSIINSASLTIEVFDPSSSGATIGLHEMFVSWSDSATWNGMGTGIQTNGVEASATAVASIGSPDATGSQTFNGLEATVQRWSEGATNDGWVIISDNTNGWDFRSSEYSTTGERPTLTIDYTAPTPSQASVTHTLVVDTASDILDGDTSSIDLLLVSKGADGFISLREAIEATNNTINSGGPDQIQFSISTGLQTIDLTSLLPAITDAVIIDGTTQPGAGSTPRIELNGTSAGANSNGLFIVGDNVTVRGLAVNRFDQTGIRIVEANNTLIAGNFIGTNAAGTAALGNGADGIDAVNADNITIGGTVAADRNVISGNSDDGIDLDGVTNSFVQGNYVGLDVTGTVDLGNADTGILLELAAAGNTIGGTTAAARNVISGNQGHGIYIIDAGTTSNLIQGNYIGTNAAGTVALGNTLDGVRIENDADGNTIGGTAAGAGNVISGNADGIGIQTNNNSVQGNYIGTDAAGTAALRNLDNGVDITNGASNNTIGGTTAAARNIISGNTNDGIYIEGATTTGNLIQGNYIGTDVNGTLSLGNGLVGSGSGIRAFDAGTNTIGGVASGAGNLISRNANDGIAVEGTSTGITIRGNSILKNGELGIDLNSDEITANDANDADTGPNNLQNFPALSSAKTNGTNAVTISGSITSTASTTFDIDFYSSSSRGTTTHGEGATFLGTVSVTTNGSGVANFSPTLVQAVAIGDWITATATDPGGSTSEFSLSTLSETSNTPPTTSDNTVVTDEDVAHTFALADFNFSDGDGDALDHVQITQLESVGSLKLSGGDVTLGQTISATDISLGNLQFIPVNDASGANYDSFKFRVSDGTSYSAETASVALINASFAADAEGFTYADDTFGTSQPTLADGSYSGTDGLTGGGLVVNLGPNSSGLDVSGGWSRSFNVSADSVVRITLDSRMVMSEMFESDEYGELVLEIDGVRYGNDTNSSLVHMVGNGNGGGTEDSGWRQDTLEITLTAGSHTLTIGAYNNKGTAGDEWVDAYFDNVVVTELTHNQLTVDVTAVNDPPINAVPGTQTVDEETQTAIAGISVTDVDAAAANITTRLQVSNGVLDVTLSGAATISAGANSSNDLTLQGNVTDVNATLASLLYTGDTDVTGVAADTLTVTTNDGGNTGTGGAKQDVDNVQIDITAVNDAPFNTVPGTQTVDEETQTAIAGISVTDVDAAAANITTRLQVGNGVLDVTLSGAAAISAGANGTGDLTIQGNVTDVNATLASLLYTGDTDVTGVAADTLTVTTNDGGNTGTGGAKQDVDNVQIDITAVNDAPINTVPGTQTVDEETQTAIAGISVTDVDAAAANITTRLQVSNGVLDVTLSGAATISAGANSSNDLTLQGNVTDVNATLASLLYTGDTDVTGVAADTLTVTTNDGGNTGTGGAKQDVDNVQIDITAVNDAPINTVPGTQTVGEETQTAIAGVSVTDVDAAAANITTRLQVSNGVLDVTLSGAATISAGANSSNDLTLQGNVTDVNATLASLLYTGDTDVTGVAADTLTVTTNDGGNTGTGGAKQDVDNVQIDITAVNDAPINTVPGTQTVDEETQTAIAGISVTDVDAAAANITTRLQVGNGVLDVTLSGAATISAGANGTGDLTIQGNLTDVNATLASLLYTGDTDVTGVAADTLTVTTNDAGNTGTGGAKQDVDNVQIDITAVNDAPVNTVPGTQTVDEEVQTAIAGISVTDVDAAAANITTRLQVSNGVLDVTLSGAATISAGANGTGDLTIQGNVTDVNATLASLLYTGDTDVTGVAADTLTVTTNDAGNTGTGGAKQDVDNVQIDITAVNDAPINTVPGTQTVDEETQTAIAGVSVTDVDAAAANITTRLQVSNGVLDVTLSGAATISAGANSSNDLTLQGNVTDVNATLASLLYTGDTDVTGVAADALTVTTNDGGNTGTGGAKQDVDNVQIDITAVNDAPVNTVPGTQTVDEEVQTAIAGISVTDVDAAVANITTRLQVSNGVLDVTLSGAATISAGANSSNDLTIQGNVTDVNATLASLLYTGDTDVTGVAADTLTVTTNDAGNTGTGGAKQDVDNVQIDITAVNDTPINTVPGTQTVDEEVQTAIAGISVTDVDAAVANITTRLQVSNGVLDVTLSGAATISAGANSSNDLTLQGNVTDVNATLVSLLYTGDTDVTGVAADTLTVTTNDGGNTGTGGAKQDVDNVQIDITAVNDAPINTVPGTQTVDEEAQTAIAGISVTDVDAAVANITTRLQVSNGVLDVTLSGAATISAGANSSNDLTLQGNVTDVNATLASLLYTGDTDVTGVAADTLTVTTNDGGNTGTGGAKQDVDNVQIDITAVNDAPINTVPGTQTVDEETQTAIAGISVTDVDAAAANITTRLQVSNGVLDVTLSGAATISAGANSSNDLTLQGNVTDVNATLVSLLYTGDTDVTGVAADTLTVTTNDGGNTGTGGAKQDVDNVQIDITAVNDAPVNTVPGTQTVDEEVQTAIAGISVTDVDAAAANITTRLQVSNGVLDVTLSGAATISAGANGTGDLTIQGNVTDVNATLASLLYTGDTDVTGVAADTLTVTTNDAGNTGTGGAKQDVDNVQIDITNLNDVPEATANTVTANEDNTFTFAVGDFTYIDTEGDALVSVTITNQSLGGGRLELSGATVNNGDKITAAQIANLVYTPTANGNGSPLATFDFTVNDSELGVVAAQMDIDITAVNDAPIAVNDSFTTEEDTPLSGDVSLNDSDVEGDTLTFTLTTGALNGSVTLAPNGSFIYTPNADFNGIDSFVYSVTDGNGGFATGTAVMNINPVDDMPSEAEQELLKQPVDTPAGMPPLGEGDAIDPTENATEEEQEMASASAREMSHSSADAQVESVMSLVPPLADELAEPFIIEKPDATIANIRNTLPFVGRDAARMSYVHDMFASLAIDNEGLHVGQRAGLDWNRLWDSVDTLEEEVSEFQTLQVVVGSAAVVSTAVSVSYVLWSIRGASLVASMISSLPAWALIDPLPIVDIPHERRAGLPSSRYDDESMQDIVERGREMQYEKLRV